MDQCINYQNTEKPTTLFSEQTEEEMQEEVLQESEDEYDVEDFDCLSEHFLAEKDYPLHHLASDSEVDDVMDGVFGDYL